MTVLILCLAFLLPTGSIARDMLRDTTSRPQPRPKRMYEAPFRQPGGKLPARPEGMASLKAEIALTPPGQHRVPELPPARKDHDDWRFSTEEFHIAWESWFEGQPEDQAVVYAWAGTGRG